MLTKWIAATLTLALMGAFSFAQPVADGAIVDGEYANTLVHAESGASLFWTIEGENLHMGFIMASNGWAGIGWLKEQTNRKAGGDILMVTENDGELVHLDMFQVAARGEPVVDSAEGGSDSYTAMAIDFSDGVWTVEFVRPLVTGQETDIDIVAGDEYVLMVAFSNVMDISRAHARSTSGGAYYLEGFRF